MPTTTDQTQSQDQVTAKDWPHAPIHRLDNDGIYIITAGTHYKEHFFNNSDDIKHRMGRDG